MSRAPGAAAAAAIALVATYLALGGGDYDVARPADPCSRPAPPARAGVLEGAQRVGLTALDSAACELGISRERLMLVLAGEVPPPPGVGRERREAAFRSGLREAIDAEERAGRLGATEALVLRTAIELAPVDALLERVFGAV